MNFIKKIGTGRVVVVCIALLLVVMLFTTMSSVPAGYTGILTTYGKIEDETIDAGLHFKFPWQRIVKLDNRVQTLRIASGVDGATTSDTAETKDQQLIPKFEFGIQYQLNPEMSHTVYSNYGEDYAKVLLTSNGLQFIKEIFALYNAEEIVSAKGAIPEKVMQCLNEVTEPLGVNIVRVNMVTYAELDSYLRQLYLYSIPVKELYGRYPSCLMLNCYRSGELIQESFSVEALKKAKTWAANTVESIIATDHWSPRMDYYHCKYLCGVQEHCEYYAIQFGHSRSQEGNTR